MPIILGYGGNLVFACAGPAAVPRRGVTPAPHPRRIGGIQRYLLPSEEEVRDDDDEAARSPSAGFVNTLIPCRGVGGQPAKHTTHGTETMQPAYTFYFEDGSTPPNNRPPRSWLHI